MLRQLLMSELLSLAVAHGETVYLPDNLSTSVISAAQFTKLKEVYMGVTK
jgi:hypothetical protein